MSKSPNPSHRRPSARDPSRSTTPRHTRPRPGRRRLARWRPRPRRCYLVTPVRSATGSPPRAAPATSRRPRRRPVAARSTGIQERRLRPLHREASRAAPRAQPPRPPETSGAVERFNQTLKYEHLYREEIADVIALADEVTAFPRPVQHDPAPRVARLRDADRGLLGPPRVQPIPARKCPRLLTRDTAAGLTATASAGRRRPSTCGRPRSARRCRGRRLA